MATRPGYLRPGRLVRTADKAERDRFYGSARWERFRLAFLADHPICCKCHRAAATIVHHVIDRLLRPDLAWDEGNLEGQCSPCHTRLHKGKA